MRRRAQVHDVEPGTVKADLGAEMAVKRMRHPEHRTTPRGQGRMHMVEAGNAHRRFPATGTMAFQHLEEGEDALGAHVAENRLGRRLRKPRAQGPADRGLGRCGILGEIADRHRAQQPCERRPVTLRQEPGGQGEGRRADQHAEVGCRKRRLCGSGLPSQAGQAALLRAFRLCAASVRPRSQMAPGTRWLSATTCSKPRRIQARSSWVSVSGGISLMTFMP